MSHNNSSIFKETDATTLNISYIYVSDTKSIERIKKQRIKLQTPKLLSKEELLTIIQRNRIIKQEKYKLLSITLYNLDINQDELTDYMQDYEDITHTSKLLTPCSHITDISIKNTLSMFDDLNTLYIIYYKKTDTPQNTTKKIYMCEVKPKTNKTRRS